MTRAVPAAELPAVMIAANAKLKVKGQKSERWIEAKDFFTGVFSTALQPDELLIEIVIPPMPPRTGWAFQEVARRHGDYALAGVACTLTLDAKDVCTSARIVLLGLSGQPVDARNAAKYLIHVEPNADAIRAASEAIDAEIDPSTDIHASTDFRRHLAKTLTQRALEQAINRAKES